MSDILLGVVIGGALTLAGTVGVEFIRGKFESSLDKEKRADDRRIERDRFQRATLEAVQEAVREHMTVVGKIHTTFAVAARKSGGGWGGRVEPELDLREQTARQSVTLLRSRVADDALRELLERLIHATGEVVLARDPNEARDALAMAAERPRRSSSNPAH